MELSSIVEFRTSKRLIDKLEELGFSKTFDEGDIIQKELSAFKAIPIVLEGALKVIRADDNGRELLLFYIHPGETCIMTFFGGIQGDTCKIIVRADEKTLIHFIPIHHVPYLNKEFPEWLSYIFRLYHQRFEELLEVVNAIAFKKMDERLVSALKQKVSITSSNEIVSTHEQLALELGTARTVISRLLKQLEENGKVKLGRNKITVL